MNLNYAIRHGIRGLVRDRAFSVVALVSIGLGVGANSAIFSLVDQALFRQLPVRNPDRLVLLSWSGTNVGRGWGSGNLLPYPLYHDLSAENQVFDGMFCRAPTIVHLSIDGTPEPVGAEIVSGTYFSILGIHPAAGRLIAESDDLRPGEHPVVVISFDFWQNRLGGASGVVGRKVLINNYPMTVIGVAARGFHGIDWGDVPSVWIPTMMKRQATPEFDWLLDRRGFWLHVFGRLKPVLTMAQAEAGLQPWFKAMLREETRREGWPPVSEETRKRFMTSTLKVLPGSQGRSDMRRKLEKPLLVLLAATAIVLLLACLNVANLCLARAFARRRETALRLALGASPGRVVRESLVQSLILALGGAALGLLLAPVVSQTLISFLPHTLTAVDLSPDVNPRILLFALATALLTGVLFGMAPALQASQADPATALKAQSTSVAGAVGLRKVLVVGQIALALILLIGAGLFVRTLAELRSRGPGFATTNLLLFRVDLARSGYAQTRSNAVMRSLLLSLRAAPEVASAGLAMAELLSGGSWNQPLTIQSGSRIVTDSVNCNAISPGFIDTLGAKIVSGRDFNDRDAQDLPNGNYRSAIVNESFARRYFGGRNPIGARLALDTLPNSKAEIEIVGVAPSFAYRGLRSVDDQAFFPAFERPFRGAGFWVRTRAQSQSAFSSIRAAVRQIDAGLPIIDLRTVDDQLDRTLLNERLLATLSSAFALLAVLLAVVGLYGVMAFVVSHRTREIGIRLALGASRGAAVWLVLREAAVMVAVGLAIALPTVWQLGRLIESQLFGVRAMDGTIIAGAAALVGLVALAASALPVRRATSINPVEALRYE